MNFDVAGPFPVERQNGLVSTGREDKNAFWESVENWEPGLADAIGCYIFVVRGRAWYVGMAARQCFCNEIFSPHKLNQYNQALARVTGKPSIILIAKVTPGNRYARPGSGHGDIPMLEDLLIGLALGRNPDLQNIKGTKILKNMRVPGLLNSQQGWGRATSVQVLKRALGI